MSTTDQCPSSKKTGKPVMKPRATPHELVGASGQKYWRGLDDIADTQEFREHLEREFPVGASELLEGGRRTFLKLMGAGLALAGAVTLPGCRRPDHKILPYSRSVPEDVIPGKSLYFATSMPLPGGGAEGLLVETHEGRPTKIEGNPLHPVNLGKSSVWSQASVLDLYDPDRLKEPEMLKPGTGEGGKAEYLAVTWDDFGAWSKKHFAQFDRSQGEGLAIICDKRDSLTLDSQRAALKAKWPKAVWVSYSSLENSGAAAGAAAAFGKPMRESLTMGDASVLVSLDRDFLQYEAGSLVASRQWGGNRRILKTSSKMCRLYALECNYSITGASADHRIRLSPQQVSSFAVQLARIVLERGPKDAPAAAALAAALKAVNVPADAAVDAKHVEVIAKDLIDPANAGKSLVMAGASQPAWVHGLCIALNRVLGNIGKTVSYIPTGADDTGTSLKALTDAAKAMAAGTISTVVTLNCNPVYNAPADAGFAAAYAKVGTRVALSVDFNETVEAATWRLNGAHYLEQWGDTVAADGTVAPIQPMIAPLYGGKSDIEIVAMLCGQEKTDGYDITRAVWSKKVGADFEKGWRKALHTGVLEGSASKAEAAAVNIGAVAQLVSEAKLAPAPTQAAMHLAFATSVMHDGRFANNAWVNELPDPASKIVWDNAALLSPKTAEALELHQTEETDKKPKGRVADISVGGRTVRMPCWAVPGIPDNTVVLPLGFGRSAVGLVGQGVGFNTFAVRTSQAPWSADGVSVKPAEEGDRWYNISVTQSHGSMEGRAIVREADVQAYAVHGDHVEEKKDSYGRPMSLSFAEQLEGGEFNHMPAAVPVMVNPFDNKEVGKDPKRADRDTPGTAAFSTHPQWGMSIDLSSCTGCNVCTIACQAENNIPVVGKIETQKGREMHWIRVDRYFKGDDINNPDGMVFQPVACVHCENAPCETVCPVNATVHGPEGHNYMVYNRCIGTRYCANNCPYKVRRFNFFDYGVTKFNGKYFGQETLEGVLPDALASSEKTPHRLNPNLIPPRLRDKLDEISRLQKNPNVTVRSRGVMEKCSYCIQRTNEAKIELKVRGLRTNDDGIPDGFVQTACQQACPTSAIVFGDVSDTTTKYKNADNTERTGSLVHQMRMHGRTYQLLGYLGVLPRTTYMARINNPNADLRAPVTDPFGHHGAPHGGGSEHKGHAAASGTPFIDNAKVGHDGYVMSLSVLGGRA